MGDCKNEDFRVQFYHYLKLKFLGSKALPTLAYSPTAVLGREIDALFTRPVGWPSSRPNVFYDSFPYQAASWHRLVAKVEWHQEEWFPRVGFMVTNLIRRAKNVGKFYKRRGTAEQWITAGNNVVQ